METQVSLSKLVTQVNCFIVNLIQWRIQDFLGSTNSGGVRQHIIMQNLYRKLHENERILTEGGRPTRPFGSTTVIH